MENDDKKVYIGKKILISIVIMILMYCCSLFFMMINYPNELLAIFFRILSIIIFLLSPILFYKKIEKLYMEK